VAKPEFILITDVGSTTTKAVLIAARTDQEYYVAGQANAPTTVEAPEEDVMIGVRAALQRLTEKTGRLFLRDGRLVSPAHDGAGVDLFLSTSSAGGGLQMLVGGLIKTLTAESAHRAALGAGAIVMDVLALDDGRLVVERIKRLRELRPDMILLSGGTDDGNISQVAALAEQIAAAKLLPRWGGGERTESDPQRGRDFKVPLVFAGNRSARDYVEKVLGDQLSVHHTDNLRPVLEKEVLEPARQLIHQLFLEHVMRQAPGYAQLLDWTVGHIDPTPLAVGKILLAWAKKRQVNLLAFDIGGATTDVFSVLDGHLNRTVSANLGMSYSLGNVLAEVRPEKILRWLPFELSERDLRNWILNKVIRPTALPTTAAELLLEQASAREALRLALEHHKSLTVTLRGVQQSRSIAELFHQTTGGQPLLDIKKIKAIIGSGGVLSQVQKPAAALLVLADAAEPEGITEVYIDNTFILPHLGILSDQLPDLALHLLEKEGLIPLGTIIAPSGLPRGKTPVAWVKLHLDGQGEKAVEVPSGQLALFPLSPGQRALAEVIPAAGFDVGAGRGVRIKAEVWGGVVGLVLDGRGRPLALPDDPEERRNTLRSWSTSLSSHGGEDR